MPVGGAALMAGVEYVGVCVRESECACMPVRGAAVMAALGGRPERG